MTFPRLVPGPAGEGRHPILRAAAKPRILLLLASWSLLVLSFSACTGRLDGPGPAVPGEVELLELDGGTVTPAALAEKAGTAAVLLFTRADCPISNRYAPEVQRLAEENRRRGIDFYLVYPDPDATAGSIREHLAEFSYRLPALRDPDHDLVAAAGARVTPEVAVFDPRGSMVYRGRIDDRWASFGTLRSAPTRRDLEEVLAVLATGGSPEPRTTEAVGCYIEDLS